MTTTTIQEDVKEYMRACVKAGDCTNPSMLAEAACDEFDAWDEDDYVPLGFFEWAYEVVYEDEPSLKILAPAAAAVWIAEKVSFGQDEPAIEDDYEWIRTGC